MEVLLHGPVETLEDESEREEIEYIQGRFVEWMVACSQRDKAVVQLAIDTVELSQPALVRLWEIQQECQRMMGM